MEGSEDDAGTATNASRRVSAREKNVGLVEDVNKATSSLQQKQTQEQSSSETHAMSEDNFDGDSVPSPSSQDVNTSTEAILDMIDEIVDGPDAPKRLPLTSEFVDELNAEVATTSCKLKIIQESCMSDSENIIPLQTGTDVSVAADSELSILENSNTPPECSSDIKSLTITKTSVDSLTGSSCVSKTEENIILSNVESGTLSNCPPLNFPSSSEELTVQPVCDNSASDPQDRTNKCVTSSGSRDKVTVESAEPTSSDSSVSESKTLFLDPQTRSPLRRKLVRPVPSDRRPDSTVSSTVDSVSLVEKSNSENIIKDVTSSSDSVLITHGNVKPEEISNVSEINFCKAETSVSPKKIKLIRQKSTGIINKETPLNLITTDNEQCQSTSNENNTVDLSILRTESSSTLCLSQSQEVKSSGSEKLHEPPCPVEATHSRSRIDLQSEIDNVTDSSLEQKQCVAISLATGNPNSSCNSEEETESVPALNLSTIKTDIKSNDFSILFNTHDNDDYIPLQMPTKSKVLKSKTSDIIVFQSDHSVLETKVSKSCETVSRSNESQSPSIMPHSKSNSLESKNNDLQAICHEVETKVSEPQLNSSDLPSQSYTKLRSIISESKVTEIASKCIELEVKSSKLETCDFELQSSDPVSKHNDLDTSKCSPEADKSLSKEKVELSCEQNLILSKNSSTESKTIQVQSEKIGEQQQSSIESSISVNFESIESNVQSKECEIENKGSNIKLNDNICNVMIDKVDSKSCDLEPSSSTSVQSKLVEVPARNMDLTSSLTVNCKLDIDEQVHVDLKKVPPIKLNLPKLNISDSKLEVQHSSINKNHMPYKDADTDSTKQVPKLTIKLKQSEEMKSPMPKVTIKPIKPPVEQDEGHILPIPSVTKINIKPLVKPIENVDEKPPKNQLQSDKHIESSQQVPSITKLNIKPLLKPPEKINVIHRKSSSSEISESECSENDETTSTSDQASASDNGSSEVVPKVTIKLGKPGTESEGKFYTEKNIPKLTIKGVQNEEKVIVSHSEDIQPEKVPKLTIKTVTKTESQPLSPKLTIKPLKPPDSPNKEGEVSKHKITVESYCSSIGGRESPHVPKITIKPVTRMDGDFKSPKKLTTVFDSSEHVRAVTKINIKPILKPTDSGESSENFADKVPVISKLNIKPVVKPKDNDVDSSTHVNEVPKITKLNIKPIKIPGDNSSNEKDSAELKAVNDGNSIPVITRINIKPIAKPQEYEKDKDSGNLSSETGTSSDDNADHIPVVTKLNIKPIVKPEEFQEASKSVPPCELSIPVVTKLNIKPLLKPGERSPTSPKKEPKIDLYNTNVPVVTKLNIKPIVRPEDVEVTKIKDDNEEKVAKNPPLVMKINMKSVSDSVNRESDHIVTDLSDKLSPSRTLTVKKSDVLEKPLRNDNKSHETESINDSLYSKVHSSPVDQSLLLQNCVPEEKNEDNMRTSMMKKTNVDTSMLRKTVEKLNSPHKSTVKSELGEAKSVLDDTCLETEGKHHDLKKLHEETDVNTKQLPDRQKVSPVQNCTLLKKLLENTREPLDKKVEVAQMKCTLSGRSDSTIFPCKNIANSEHIVESGKSRQSKTQIVNSEDKAEIISISEKVNDLNKLQKGIVHSIQELTDKVIDKITKPLEIAITDKISSPSSGQDSPRIILKINKTDHGSSAKIITEDIIRPDTPKDNAQNTQDMIVNDKQSPKKNVANSKKKQATDTSLNLSTGKRLRSSRIVENTDKSPIKRYVGKRPPTAEVTTSPNKETELTTLQSKRLKLGQNLSGNTPLSITPVLSPQTSPTISETKPINHSLLHNENCSKNGNSKLHNILSNLQAKQMQSLPMNNTNCSEKAQTVPSDIEFNTSMSSSDTTEVTPAKNTQLEEMIINENSEFRHIITVPEEVSRDPLEVDAVIPTEMPVQMIDIPKSLELTPQPKRRGRPRKVPLSEGAKPAVLPVPALEERPQRSLRLMRDKPPVLSKPRGRGRGRGARRADLTPHVDPVTQIESPEDLGESRLSGEIDPMSSRIKLPRMTEALDKMPSMCTTPLSSRRRSSGSFSMGEGPDLKVTADSSRDDFPNTPEPYNSGRGRGGRGSRGGRGRTPRGRGRGRGGGRGAMYMKETLGIYGRVCGPATTTVQLFEEETCMMDDNATPAKPSHLLDEDSVSSVKSSTNESSKMKKSKFADLFDSNKVWTAADVKEYTWPPAERPDEEQKVMMIQEQVAMFLGVKSFKRRYPELKRRTISGEERDYVLSRRLVTEALCELGITAVDASDVLDIMLSDYPHKYEEYRSHQRQRQLTGTSEEFIEECKPEIVKLEVKEEKLVDQKPDLPKVDPEKIRMEMAAAAIASASEFNARLNISRRGACADLQSMTVLRPRAAPSSVRSHVCPPAGFYPHALLPGQYQHAYRVYTPEQLRYFPLNTVIAAPPAPPSVTEYSSESEPEWGSRYSSSDDSDVPHTHSAKRKKLTKLKRTSNLEPSTSAVKEEPRDEVVEVCRVCKLRLEANRKYTHERFLVCANCNAKLHPGCVELNADTIRKCREYPWQCAECKTCCACRLPADDDKMLFCDLCDRGFHIYCVGLGTVPTGRWHCVECAICKSCGARSAEGLPGGGSGGGLPGGSGGTPAPPAEWHHQTRRGPGGHKVYSHSLCTPCARAYRIGRYCPLCERSFIGPKGTMQLVICKLCDRQLHQECVRQTVSSLNVLDYTCAECRRGGITSRAAAVRLAPRTIATLFMAKRRFNKYAHRQYMETRMRELAAVDDNSTDVLDDQDASDPLDVPADTEDAPE